MPQIWLDPETFQQQAGQIWAQGMHAQLQAGQDWAQGALQQAVQPIQDSLSKLQSMVPQVPSAPTTPAPAPPPTPAPAPVPAPTPVPTPPPPIAPPPPPPGATPTAEPTPAAAPGPAGALPTPPPAAPTPTVIAPTPPAPTPSPTDVGDVGQNWANEQIKNLLGFVPGQQVPQPTNPAAAALPGVTSTSNAATNPSTSGAAVQTAQPSQPSQPSTSATATQTGAPGLNGAIDSSSPEAFARSFAPYAQYAAQKLGIDPTLITAMAGSESNYGKAAGNELFGVKALPGEPGTTMMTHEGEGGGTQMNQDFASYATPLDAVNRWIGLIHDTYPNAMGAQTAQDLANGLKNGVHGLQYMTAGEGEYANLVQGIQGRIGSVVQDALSGAQAAVSGAGSPGSGAPVNTPQQGAQAVAARNGTPAAVEPQRQFETEAGLSTADAYTACGPVAAAAFAQTYGRNPSPTEAIDLARQVGWNPGQGMAGPGSEVQLLNKMGVDAHLTNGVNWTDVQQSVSSGNPVILSTPNHYLYADGYNAQTGEYHVGASGSALAGGSEWMTPDQIASVHGTHGAAQAAIFVDHPIDGSGLTMGQNQPVSPSDVPKFGTGARGLIGTQAQADALVSSSQDLGRRLVNQVVSGGQDLTNALLNQQTQNIKDAVQNVGQSTLGQGSQDLLNQGRGLLGQGAQSLENLLNQPIQSVEDTLRQNALLSQGIPTGVSQATSALPSYLGSLVGGAGTAGQDLLGMGQQALSDFNTNLAQPATLTSNPTMWALQNLIQPQVNAPAPWDPAQQALQDSAMQKYLHGHADQVLPEEQAALNQLGMTVGLVSPTAMAAAAPAAVAPISLGEWIRGAYRGGVVSSLNTAADVAFNSTLTPILSGGAGLARDLASFSPGRAAGRLLGAQSGLANWGGNFLAGLSDSFARPTSLAARAGPGVPGVIARAIEGPGAIHGAFQNATAELLAAMERGAAAGDAASGSSGAAWFSNFHSAFTNPTAETIARAQGLGGRAAARSELGTLAGGLGQAVTGLGPAGDALFPVYRMGMNFASRLVESTPLGLAGTGFDVVRGLRGSGPYADIAATGLRNALDVIPTPRIAGNAAAVGPLGERLANNLIGTAVSVWLANQALAGNVTGSGPTDPDQRRVWLASGVQPNSFRVPGSDQYRSWDRLPPQLKGPLMMAGAYADAQMAAQHAQARADIAGPNAYGVQDPRWAAAAQLLSEVGHQLTSATPLRTFANLYDTLSSGGGAAEAGLTGASDIASSIAGGALPESGLVRSVTQMTDPYERATLTPRLPQQLPQAVAENVMSNLPGLRENLPVRPDILGRPTPNPLQGLAGLIPTRAAAGQPSPVLQAMQNAGVTTAGPPSTTPVGQYQQVALTPAEQRVWTQLHGQMLQQVAGGMVSDPSFRSAPPNVQRLELQRADAIATRVADKEMLGQLGPDALRPAAAGGRLEVNPNSVLAPAVGYGPNVVANQQMLQQQLQAYQAQALLNSIMGGAAAQPSSQQRLQALLASS